MPVSIEEVQAEVIPETAQTTSSEGPRPAPPPDMDRVRCELRRDDDRCTRLWAD